MQNFTNKVKSNPNYDYTEKIIFSFFLLLSLSLSTLQAQTVERKLITRKISKADTPKDENNKALRVVLGAGYAHWNGETLDTGNKQLNDFSSGLKPGYNLNIESEYFFHEYIGVGLDVNYIRHSNKDKKLGINETDNILFWGATCNFRYENQKWAFFSGLGLGPVFYSGDANVNSANTHLNKTTVGLSYNISGEYRFSRAMGAGIKLSAATASVKIDGTTDRMSLSNLMITGFISFRTK